MATILLDPAPSTVAAFCLRATLREAAEPAPGGSCNLTGLARAGASKALDVIDNEDDVSHEAISEQLEKYLDGTQEDIKPEFQKPSKKLGMEVRAQRVDSA